MLLSEAFRTEPKINITVSGARGPAGELTPAYLTLINAADADRIAAETARTGAQTALAAVLAALAGATLTNVTLNAASRTLLAALNTGLGLPAYLTETGREGIFTWVSTNQSANVTADPSQGVYVAPASAPSGASGAWVRRHGGALTPAMFGAVGDDAADDRGALLAAANLAAFLRVPLEVTRKHFLNVTATASFRYPSDLTMVCFSGHHFRWSAGDLPCLWGQGANNVRIVAPKFVFSGNIPTGSTSAAANTFYNALGRAAGDHIGAGSMGCGFGMFGGDNVWLTTPTFTATDFSAPGKLMPNAALFMCKPGAILSENCGIEGPTLLDGCVMGILGGGQKGFRMGGVRSKRYGILDPAIYLNTPPPHAVYFSGQTTPTITSVDCEFGNLYDESIPVPGNANVSAGSWKFIKFDGLRVGTNHGKRPFGLFEIYADKFDIGFMSWQPSTAAAATLSAVQAQGPCSEGTFAGGRFVLPADFPATRGVFGMDLVTDGATNEIDFGRQTVIQKGPLIGWLISGTLQNCEGHFTYRAPNNTYNDFRAISVINGGDDNRFVVDVELPDIAGKLAVDCVRLSEDLPASSTNNSLVINDIRTGSTVTLNQGQRHGTYRVKQEVGFTNGATSGDAMVLPAGAVLRHATAVTTVADGTATAWSFGTPTTPTLLGTRGNFVVGGGITDANWTNHAQFRQNTPVTLRVTVTGVSNGVGKVLTAIVYDVAFFNVNTLG